MVRTSASSPAKYELLRYVAAGGMAEVFLARAGGIGGFEKLVVVKRIRPELARHDVFQRMFLAEARLAAALHHTNIVQVYDVAMVDDALLTVMEFLHGKDLRAVVRRAEDLGVRLPLAFGVGATLAVCAGLHAAHEAVGPKGDPLGIVHRDVSPHNVFITYDGVVKLIDFGIAKARDRVADETGSGVMKGKPGYLSPEQCLGDPIDRRSDLFCVGILLYELTHGKRLFPGDGSYAHLRSIVECDVPLTIDSGYPLELSNILEKLLAKSPSDRFATAREVQNELEVVAARHGFDVSAFALSRTMGELFKSELTAWEMAAQEGVPIEQRVGTSLPRSVRLGVASNASIDATPSAVATDPKVVANATAPPASPAAQYVSGTKARSWAWTLAVAALAAVSSVVWFVTTHQRQEPSTASAAPSAETPRDSPSSTTTGSESQAPIRVTAEASTAASASAPPRVTTPRRRTQASSAAPSVTARPDPDGFLPR